MTGAWDPTVGAQAALKSAACALPGPGTKPCAGGTTKAESRPEGRSRDAMAAGAGIPGKKVIARFAWWGKTCKSGPR